MGDTCSSVTIAISVPTGTTTDTGQPDVATAVYEVPTGLLDDVLAQLAPHRKAMSR